MLGRKAAALAKQLPTGAAVPRLPSSDTRAWQHIAMLTLHTTRGVWSTCSPGSADNNAGENRGRKRRRTCLLALLASTRCCRASRGLPAKAGVAV